MNADPKNNTNILLAGVGGQGILLASEVLSEVALHEGLDIKKSEVHGMAQRGGSVVSQVRFGQRVDSPLIVAGEADFLVAFEEMESLRYLHYLKGGGVLIINRQRIYTLSILVGDEIYPEASLHSLENLPLELIHIDGPEVASRSGSPKVVNLAVLGVLAAKLDFDTKKWEDVISRRVPPKMVEINLKAFREGMKISYEKY